jgi:hypothetical protein
MDRIMLRYLVRCADTVMRVNILAVACCSAVDFERGVRLRPEVRLGSSFDADRATESGRGMLPQTAPGETG